MSVSFCVQCNYRAIIFTSMSQHMKRIRIEAGSDLWWMYHSRVAMNVTNIIIIETRNPSSLGALINLNSLSHTYRTL